MVPIHDELEPHAILDWGYTLYEFMDLLLLLCGSFQRYVQVTRRHYSNYRKILKRCSDMLSTNPTSIIPLEQHRTDCYLITSGGNSM